MIKETEILDTTFEGIEFVYRGKVRDIYDCGEHLLIVTTDRISAFDVVMPQPIPNKGKILNQMSLFWFNQMQDIINNHIVSTNPDEYPSACKPYRDILNGRSMLVKKAKALPVECIVRGYISGSGWKDYCQSGMVSGITLPKNLQESSKLPVPLFAPSTKAEIGEHDMPMSMKEVEAVVGKDIALRLHDATIMIYQRAAELALGKGIIIADTKMEFGIFDGKLIIVDELLTPDASRFWPANKYEEGRGQNSFDKQFLRDYLLSIQWEQKPPAPQLPADIIAKTSEKYMEAFERIVGTKCKID